MNMNELLQLIKNGENQETEFKEGCPANPELSEVICAFANTDGGNLLLGITKNGSIKGLNCDLDKLQQNIANANQTVHSPPIISTTISEINSKKIAVVQVSRANDKNAHTFRGVVYVRIGSTTRRLEGQALFAFLKNKQILCFDEQDSEAEIKDLDETKVKSYLSKRGQDSYTHAMKDFLVSNMLAKSNGDIKIKNAATLFFSKEPYKWFPQNEIRVVKFSGVQQIEVISQRDFRQDPFENIENTLDFIRQNISKRFIMQEGSARRTEIDEYPLNAIREAVVNAVAHRDYYSYDAIQINIFEDRIEINNPGGLPEGLSKEFFGKRSVRRNPITYRLLRDCHYVEGLGTGVPKMINEMRKTGLKDPEFTFDKGFFQVTLKNIKSSINQNEGMHDLTQRQITAIEYLKQNKTLKSKTYANINNISLPTALKEIEELIKFKCLKKIGEYRGAYYVLNEDKTQN